MPIVSIIQQPGSNSVPKIFVAYRPIVFRIAATGTISGLGVVRTPPIVFCDIYFNDVFYKTLSATQSYYLDYTNTRWEFDISASAQEYLRFNLPANGGTVIEPSPLAIASCYVKFRSSGTDANGFIAPEGPLPRQSTGTYAAAFGGGTKSETFQIMNAVLQHEDNQDFKTHLQYARPNGSFQADTYPLTHRPNGYKVCKTDSDHYPFLHLGNKILKKISVVKTSKSGETTTSTFNVPQTCSSVVSGLAANVLTNNDVQVNFDSSGPAQEWQWTINGGTTWIPVTSKAFVITFEDIIQIIVAESGEVLITEDGEIIIPEGFELFTDYDLEVRPRCVNGAFGTSGMTTYTIEEAGVCPFPTAFLYSSKNYTNSTITFSVALPIGQSNIQLEWKFDYGNGFTSNSTIQDLTGVTHPLIWPAPTMADTGTYKVRIRTNCGNGSYSSWTSWTDAPWAKPVVNVNVSLVSVLEVGGQWNVTCGLSAAVVDNVVVQGYFQGDGSFGVQSFNFTCVITAGQTTGLTTVAGAAPGGAAFNKHIQIVHPDPTSDGAHLIY